MWMYNQLQPQVRKLERDYRAEQLVQVDPNEPFSPQDSPQQQAMRVLLNYQKSTPGHKSPMPAISAALNTPSTSSTPKRTPQSRIPKRILPSTPSTSTSFRVSPASEQIKGVTDRILQRIRNAKGWETWSPLGKSRKQKRDDD